MLLKSIRKYLIVATAASVMANAALFFAWRGAITEQDVIYEQCQREALEYANERTARAAAAVEAAAAEREAELNARLDAADAAARAAADRADAASQQLSNYVTEQLSDSVSADWQAEPLPDSVTQRLSELYHEL